ncbi:hypothetical protein [Streptomyces sp. CoH27]|uniref:hypothetical protein n=1 Tax=Streptomyces sp. CoH27 TaxID=2875763 RepID=UPI001CD5C2FE|nr:hypothetical protein [Streptomyces sp. CoH27]
MQFAVADILTGWQLLAHRAAENASLIRAIVQALSAIAGNNPREGFFLDLSQIHPASGWI